MTNWGPRTLRIKVQPLVFHPEALEELHIAPLDYYENDLLEVGDALVAELNQALDQVGRVSSSLEKIFENIHSYGPTKKFKWRIVYVEQVGDIFVLAAYFSGDQDPLYWIERLAS